MENDRELLELAAKAAGVKYSVRDDEHYKTHKFFGLWIVYNYEPSAHTRRYWNPLTDDGDALRLAVSLNMGLSIPVMRTPMADVITFRDSRINVRESGNDIAALTRRAIVRVAAEIGRAMK